MANPASAGYMALIRSERCVRVRLHCQLDVTWKMAFCINSWHNDITVLHLIFTEWFRFSPLFSVLNDFSHLSSHVNSLDRQTVCFCEHNLRFTELTALGGACVLPFNELWRWWHFGTTAAATAPTVNTTTTFNVCWTGPLSRANPGHVRCHKGEPLRIAAEKFSWDLCCSWHPNNSIDALKAYEGRFWVTRIDDSSSYMSVLYGCFGAFAFVVVTEQPILFFYVFVAHFCLINLMLQQHPSIFFNHFVESIYYFNNYEGHAGEHIRGSFCK